MNEMNRYERSEGEQGCKPSIYVGYGRRCELHG